MRRVKAFCLNSLTVAWGYFLAFAGLIFQVIDAAADALNDPELKQHLANALGGDPKTIGKVMLGISIVTIFVRLRSIRKAE